MRIVYHNLVGLLGMLNLNGHLSRKRIVIASGVVQVEKFVRIFGFVIVLIRSEQVVRCVGHDLLQSGDALNHSENEAKC